jgi:hypothetical protein
MKHNNVIAAKGLYLPLTGTTNHRYLSFTNIVFSDNAFKTAVVVVGTSNNNMVGHGAVGHDMFPYCYCRNIIIYPRQQQLQQ